MYDDLGAYVLLHLVFCKCRPNLFWWNSEPPCKQLLWSLITITASQLHCVLKNRPVPFTQAVLIRVQIKWIDLEAIWFKASETSMTGQVEQFNLIQIEMTLWMWYTRIFHFWICVSRGTRLRRPSRFLNVSIYFKRTVLKSPLWEK